MKGGHIIIFMSVLITLGIFYVSNSQLGFGSIKQSDWSRFPPGTQVTFKDGGSLVFPVENITPYLDSKKNIINVSAVITPENEVYIIPIPTPDIQALFQSWLIQAVNKQLRDFLAILRLNLVVLNKKL